MSKDLVVPQENTNITGYKPSETEFIPNIRILQGIRNAKEYGYGKFVCSVGGEPIETFNFLVVAMQKVNRYLPKYDSSQEKQGVVCFSADGIKSTYSDSSKTKIGDVCAECQYRPYSLHEYKRGVKIDKPTCNDVSFILGYHLDWNLFFNCQLDGNSFKTSKFLANNILQRQKLFSLPIWTYAVQAEIVPIDNGTYYNWKLTVLDERKNGINYAKEVKENTTGVDATMISDVLSRSEKPISLWLQSIAEYGHRKDEVEEGNNEGQTPF